MAETPSKRHRDEADESEEGVAAAASNKRQNYSYNDILSLLDSSEEEEPTQDLSSLITTLQQELSSSSDSGSGHHALRVSDLQTNPEANQTSSSASSSSSSPKEDGNDQEEDRESVMRHLLEASDDELGIPNMNESGLSGGGDGDEAEAFSMAEQGLWELEDEAANYYTLLQSELFM